MTDPAAPRHRMTVEEFLAWAETQEEPYELEDGVPVPLWPRDPGEPTMMASPTVGHQQVQLNALGILQRRLQHPCWAIAGVAVAIRSRRTRVPDIVASCVPADSRSNLVGAPVLIVEVLSPTSEAKDRSRKLDEYKELGSVQEIWLVASNRKWVQSWHREESGWHVTDVIGLGAFSSRVLASAVALDELYAGVQLQVEPEGSDG